MHSRHDKRQQPYTLLNQIFDKGMALGRDIVKVVLLSSPLHPQSKWWKSTPARYWRRIFSGWHGEALRFALVALAILALLGLMSVIQ